MLAPSGCGVTLLGSYVTEKWKAVLVKVVRGLGGAGGWMRIVRAASQPFGLLSRMLATTAMRVAR